MERTTRIPYPNSDAALIFTTAMRRVQLPLGGILPVVFWWYEGIAMRFHSSWPTVDTLHTYRPAYLERGRPKGRILNPIREKEEERHHSQDDSPGTKHPAYIWLNSSTATHSNPRGKSSDPQEFVTHKESAYRDRHCQRRPCVRIGHG